MREIIYSSYRIFWLWVLLCYQFQSNEIRLKQNYILFHPLLIIKIPFFFVQKNLRWQNLANLLSETSTMFMNGNLLRKKLLTINCKFIQILYNFESLTISNKSPPQSPLGSGFCTNPPLKMTKIFGRGDL